MLRRSTITIRTYPAGEDEHRETPDVHTVIRPRVAPYNVHKWPPCKCPKHTK